MKRVIQKKSTKGRGLVPIAVILAVLLGLWIPKSVGAQMVLDRSTPQTNSVLAESPRDIRLWFVDDIDPHASSAWVLDIDGNKLPALVSEPGADDRSLIIPIPRALTNGTYTVVWAVTPVLDGQPSTGYFTFTVGSQIDIASASVPRVDQPIGAPIWIQSVARWLVLLALAVVVAIWPLWLLVLWPAARRDSAMLGMLAQRGRSLSAAGVAAALVANVFALVVDATKRTRGSLASRVGETLFESHFGRLWLAQVGLLLLLSLALRSAPWKAPGEKRWYHSTIVLVVALVVPIPIILDSHVSDLGQGRWTALIFDYVHVVAASFWFGGLVLLAAALLRLLPSPSNRRSVLAQMIPRFSATALVCWGLLAVSGLYAWWIQVGSWDALRSTPYGQALLVKLALVAVVLLIALLNLFLVTRKLAHADATSPPTWLGWLGYAVIAELVLTTLILLAVGRMASLPPGREVLAAQRFGETVHFELDDRDVVLQFVPGAAGPNHFVVTVPGDALPSEAEAFLQVTYLDQDIGSNEIELGRASLTTFETHGSPLGMAGNWNIGVTIRLSGGDEWSDTQQIAIDTTGSPIPKEPWRLGTGGVVGLLLIGIALLGFAMAWRSGERRLRRESAGLAAAAALLGVILIVQGRRQPANPYYLELSNPVAATGDSITLGNTLYAANCMACHGATGHGDGPLKSGMYPPPANFFAPHTRAHPDGQLFDWIQNGKPGTNMPAFGNTLTDEQIWDLINYIQTEFQGKAVIEGTPVATPVP